MTLVRAHPYNGRAPEGAVRVAPSRARSLATFAAGSMYETRLVGSGGKAGGIAGLGGATRGPLDYLFNGAIGILLMYLAFTIIEPFWSGAVASSNQVKWEADMKVITEAMGRYRLKQGAYQDTDLDALGPYLSKVPEDPWGNPYVIDPLLKRILSAGEDKQFGDDPAVEPGLDDRIHFFQHPWMLRVVALQDGAPLPLEVRIDGAEVRPVGGRFPAGTEAIVEDAQLRRVLVTARGPDGSLDLAWPAAEEGGAPSWVTASPAQERSPSVHRDGSFIYFEAARSSPKPLVYRIPFGGGEAQAVTEQPDSFDFPEWDGDHAPSVAPASGHLAFHSKRHDDNKYRICLVPKGNVGAAPVVLKPPLPAGTDPTWYQDGKTVAFLSLDRLRIERLPFPPRGNPKSDAIQLPKPATAYAFSPDEEYLAVVYEGASGGSDLEIRSLESGKARVVLHEAGGILDVSWVP